MRGPTRDPRKLPVRANSKETVGFVLDAVGVVLASDGALGLKVARVAKVAGVSIGSVYQYFPTKEALLTAWEERISTRVFEQLQAFVAKIDASPDVATRDVVPAFIAALFDLFREVGKLSSDQARRPGHWRSLEEPAVSLLAERLRASAEQERFLPRDLTEAARVIVLSVATCAERAGREANFDVTSFRHEVTAMVIRYLVG